MFDDGWKNRRMTSVTIYTYSSFRRWLVSEVNENERTSPLTQKWRAGDQRGIFVALTLGVLFPPELSKRNS